MITTAWLPMNTVKRPHTALRVGICDEADLKNHQDEPFGSPPCDKVDWQTLNEPMHTSIKRLKLTTVSNTIQRCCSPPPPSTASPSTDNFALESEFITNSENYATSSFQRDSTVESISTHHHTTFAQRFLSAASDPLLMHALSMKSYTGTHPVGGGTYSTVQVTLCAMYVLVNRARLSATELTPEWLLTALWLLDSYNSQYMQDLSTCLKQYLYGYYGGDKDSVGELTGQLKKVMPKMQISLLERCDWYVSLHETRDMKPAGDALAAAQEFWPVCLKVVKKSSDMTAAYWAANGASLPIGGTTSLPIEGTTSLPVGGTTSLPIEGITTVDTSTPDSSGGGDNGHITPSSSSHDYLQTIVSRRGFGMLREERGHISISIMNSNNNKVRQSPVNLKARQHGRKNGGASADGGFPSSWALSSFASLF